MDCPRRFFKTSALIIAVFSILMSSASCSSKKEIVYFQDITTDTLFNTVQPKQLVIRPNDKLSIIVNSRDLQLADMFNLPYVSRQMGRSSLASSKGNTLNYSQNQGVLGYSVDAKGDIDFPVIGSIHVAGLTRSQCSAKIKDLLISKGLVMDPTVNVEFLNTEFSVMGEVAGPGRYNLDRDNLTILEAISAAGDLTIYGKRDNVKVIRTDDDGKQHTYLVDLTSINDIHRSPVYYIQPNDVIYVEPNSTRQRQSTVNGNNIRSTSFWISLASLLTTVAVLIFK